MEKRKAIKNKLKKDNSKKVICSGCNKKNTIADMKDGLCLDCNVNYLKSNFNEELKITIGNFIDKHPEFMIWNVATAIQELSCELSPFLMFDKQFCEQFED
jgi:hypothetical protein